MDQQGDPPTSNSQLRNWFKEAQQSLGLAGPICKEANSLVTTSRKQIEQATVLWAQVMFLRDAINEQLDLIRNVKLSLEEPRDKGNEELEKTIDDLRGMEDTLDASLRNLENTKLDNAFKHDPGKNLKSFVFEDGINTVKEKIERVIDSSNDTQTYMSKDISGLERKIEELSKSILSLKYDLKLESLESAHKGADVIASNAHAMATLLESLARHYDQCLTAIEMNENDDKNSEELSELLSVLDNDSQQVGDVVNELYERRQVIEESERSVSDVYNDMERNHVEIVSYFDKITEFSKTHLTQHLSLLESCTQNQRRHIDEIHRLINEVSSLVEYYDMFFNSYHALVLEIQRRARAEQKMESIVHDMTRTLSRLHQEEVDTRKSFMEERADYLPADLWSGLSEYPPQPKIDFQKTTLLPVVSEESLRKAKDEVK